MFQAFQDRSQNPVRLKSAVYSATLLETGDFLPLKANGEDLSHARSLIAQFGKHSRVSSGVSFAKTTMRGLEKLNGDEMRSGGVQVHFKTSRVNLDNPTRVDWSRRMKDRCLRCGSKGHRARDCRSSRVCFRCNHTGHCAKQCPFLERSSPHTSLSLNSVSSRNPSTISKFQETSSSFQICHPSPSAFSIPIEPPKKVHKLKSDKKIDEKLAELGRSIVFQADPSISLMDVICEIRRCMPADQFRITQHDLYRFQILGPSVE